MQFIKSNSLRAAGKRKNMEKNNKSVSIAEIKEELRQVRYYYGRREMFDKSFDCYGKGKFLDLVQKYNLMICDAEPRLYEIYVSVYINNNTYECAADEMGYCRGYVATMHKKLIEFFYQKLNK